MSFFKDIMGRDNKWSSKKVWFNIACLTGTFVLLLVAYKDTMEDYAFICLYAVYMASIGGSEIIPKMLAMILEFKTGRKTDGMANSSVEIQK